eukprot:scaffold35512_cov24-Phaeocystis_antarctica.AAC.1
MRWKLSKGRRKRVSSRTRPAWALLVWGSSPLWHSRVRALCGSPIGDRRHGGLRPAGEPEPVEGALRLGVWIVVVEHQDEDAPRDL